MAHLKFKGFVLRTIDIGEADRLISILSSDHGLVKAYAKNARRPRSHLRLTTQNFAFCEFSVFQYRERMQIDEAEMLEPFLELQQDMDRLVCASHLAEILLDSLRDDLAQPGVYRLWAYALQAVSHRPDPLLSVHVAQLRLLMEIGFAPRLDACVFCGRPAETLHPETLFFSVTAGGLICDQPACYSRAESRRLVPPGGLACLRHVQTSALPRLFSFTLTPEVRRFFIELSAAFLSHQMEKAYTRLDMLRQLQIGTVATETSPDHVQSSDTKAAERNSKNHQPDE